VPRIGDSWVKSHVRSRAGSTRVDARSTALRASPPPHTSIVCGRDNPGGPQFCELASPHVCEPMTCEWGGRPASPHVLNMVMQQQQQVESMHRTIPQCRLHCELCVSTLWMKHACASVLARTCGRTTSSPIPASQLESSQFAIHKKKEYLPSERLPPTPTPSRTSPRTRTMHHVRITTSERNRRPR